MTPLLDSFALWLVDYYLLASALLVLALAATLGLRQPAHRITVTKSTIIALFLLAVLCALPGWSAFHLHTASSPTEPPHSPLTEPPVSQTLGTEHSAPSTAHAANHPVKAQVTSPSVQPHTHADHYWPRLRSTTALALAHALGAACVVAWLALGAFAARRLRRSAQLAPPEIAATFDELNRGENASGAQIDLLVSDRIDVPVALGITRPAILLPARSVPLPLREGPGEGSANCHHDLRPILAHELAHIRNRDLHWLAASRALLVLLWVHPLYWLLRRRMRLDQETLADAAAADVTTRRQYAEQLVACARTVATRRALHLSSAVGLWEGQSQLRRRIAILLDERFVMLRHCRLRWNVTVLAVCTIAVVGLSLLTLEPAQSQPTDAGTAPAAGQSEKETSDRARQQHPITITGRAIDQNGKHLPGARVHLATPRNGARVLATTITGANGDFRFNNVQLPIDRTEGNAVGCFELFGEAEGFGFTWRPLKWFYPERPHGNDDSSLLPIYERPTSYGRDDRIELDIRFGPAATLRGRIRNDLGEPIANTPVTIGGAHPVGDNFDARDLESFNQSLVPDNVRSRRTDNDGRFEFTDLPARHVFRLGVKPPGYTPIMIYAATQSEASKTREGSEVFGDDFEVIFERPRTVKLRIVYGDSGEPAPRVGVGGKVTEAGFWKTTDADGIVEVPLPDGQYELGVMPRYGTPYWRTEADVNVSAETAKRTTTIKLHPAAIANITVIDADTLEPVPGVDVWIEQQTPGSGTPRRSVHGYRSWEVEARISHYESPRSDEDGEMRVLFEPGSHRIGIGLETIPSDYEPIEPDGKLVDMQAGEPKSLLFQLRKRTDSRSAAQPETEGAQPNVEDVLVPSAAAPPDQSAAQNAARSLPRPEPNTVAGRVVDEKGQPMSDVEVLLFRVSLPEANREQIGQQKTVADGSFRFTRVVDVEKEFPGGKVPPLGHPAVQFIHLIVRAPGRVSDAKRMFALQMVAQHGQQQLISLAPAAQLTGRVTGPDGKPIVGALVSLSFGSLDPVGSLDRWGGVMSSRTDAEGNYKIDDAPPFEMEEHRKQQEEQQRQAQGHANQSTALYMMPPVLTVGHPGFARKKTDFEKIPGRMDVQLEPAAILQGHVVYAGSGKPVAGAQVHASTSITKQFMPAEAVYEFHRASVNTDADGNYRFTTLPAGHYDIWAEAPDWMNEGVYEIAAAADKPKTVPDLVLTKGGIVSMRLVEAKSRQPIDLQPDARALIGVYPRLSRPTSRPSYPKSTAINRDDRFEVRTLPGENHILVSTVYSGGEHRWDGATVIGEQPVRLTVAEGETAEADVPVVDVEQARAGAASAGVFIAGPSAYREVIADPKEAIKILSAALEKDPNNVDTLAGRAQLSSRLGDDRKAIADYEWIIKLNPPPPRNLIALNNLAYILATSPNDGVRDGKRAVELAEKAKQLQDAPSADVLDTLAAAYAEAGDFDRALKTQQEALQRAPPERRQHFEQFLKLYEARKPRREGKQPDPADDEDKRQRAAASKPSGFVRLVAGPKGELTFEGEEVTWDDLPARLEKVPNRSETVLEFAISSEEMSVRAMQQAKDRAMVYAQRLGFLYGSDIGVHPLGSKGSLPTELESEHSSTQGATPAVGPPREPDR